MTTKQKTFIDLFNDALKDFLKKWGITIDPRNKSKNPVKIPGCPLDLSIFISVDGNNPKNGIWITVNNPVTRAYHFPLNSGQNIILNEYSIYKTPYNTSAPKYRHLIAIFGHIPIYKEILIPLPNSVSKFAFTDALELIEKRILTSYCSGKAPIVNRHSSDER